MLHIHKNKKTPIIDTKTCCCNIYNKTYKSIASYRRHMTELNNIHVPTTRRTPAPPDLTKVPDIKDPNHHCVSCSYTFKERKNYRLHLINIHNMSHLQPSKVPRKLKKETPTIDISNLHCDVCNKNLMKKGSIYAIWSEFIK